MGALRAKPDIACFAKLLTGGTVPLAATLASRETFEAFAGDDKAAALLHGHSYSAHAIGCQVRQVARDALTSMRLCDAWLLAARSERCERDSTGCILGRPSATRA